MGYPDLTPQLRTVFRSGPVVQFSGTVYRICAARFASGAVSMRGSFLHGGRYNIRGYFGALYTSLSKKTAHQELARYFTVPPIGGLVETAVRLRLSRVVDLTDSSVLRTAGIKRERLIEAGFVATQGIGLEAWEAGIEGLLAPSAANPAEQNLVVFLDNQYLRWRLELTSSRLNDRMMDGAPQMR